jgi:hypothetical protein
MKVLIDKEVLEQAIGCIEGLLYEAQALPDYYDGELKCISDLRAALAAIDTALLEQKNG